MEHSRGRRDGGEDVMGCKEGASEKTLERFSSLLTFLTYALNFISSSLP